MLQLLDFREASLDAIIESRLAVLPSQYLFFKSQKSSLSFVYLVQIRGQREERNGGGLTRTPARVVGAMSAAAGRRRGAARPHQRLRFRRMAPFFCFRAPVFEVFLARSLFLLSLFLSFVLVPVIASVYALCSDRHSRRTADSSAAIRTSARPVGRPCGSIFPFRPILCQFRIFVEVPPGYPSPQCTKYATTHTASRPSVSDARRLCAGGAIFTPTWTPATDLFEREADNFWEEECIGLQVPIPVHFCSFSRSLLLLMHCAACFT